MANDDMLDIGVGGNPRRGSLVFYSHLLLSLIPLKEKQLRRESAPTRETASSLGFCWSCMVFSSHTGIPGLCFSQHSLARDFTEMEDEANLRLNNFVVLCRVGVVIVLKINESFNEESFYLLDISRGTYLEEERTDGFPLAVGPDC